MNSADEYEGDALFCCKYKTTVALKSPWNITIMKEVLMNFTFFCYRKFQCRVLSSNSAFSQVTRNGLTGLKFWRKCPSCLCDNGGFGKTYNKDTNALAVIFLILSFVIYFTHIHLRRGAEIEVELQVFNFNYVKPVLSFSGKLWLSISYCSHYIYFAVICLCTL